MVTLILCMIITKINNIVKLGGTYNLSDGCLFLFKLHDIVGFARMSYI